MIYFDLLFMLLLRSQKKYPNIKLVINFTKKNSIYCLQEIENKRTRIDKKNNNPFCFLTKLWCRLWSFFFFFFCFTIDFFLILSFNVELIEI